MLCIYMNNEKIFNEINNFVKNNKIEHTDIHQLALEIDITFEEFTTYLNKNNISWIYKEYSDFYNNKERNYKILSSNNDKLIFNKYECYINSSSKLNKAYNQR